MGGDLSSAVPFKNASELGDLSLKLHVRFLLPGKIVDTTLIRAASRGVCRPGVTLLTLAVALLLSTLICLRRVGTASRTARRFISLRSLLLLRGRLALLDSICTLLFTSLARLRLFLLLHHLLRSLAILMATGRAILRMHRVGLLLVVLLGCRLLRR